MLEVLPWGPAAAGLDCLQKLVVTLDDREASVESHRRETMDSLWNEP